jgi:transposase-like protein
MAYPRYLRERARQMRTKEKLSLLEIAERLALPKTTVYYWISDLPLGRPRRENGHPGNVAMQRKYRLIREEAYRQGEQEFAELAAATPEFRDFVCLYIGEGYKRNRNCVSVCNSDPAVVRFAAHWLRQFCDRPLDCSLQFHVDQKPEELIAFWADLLDVNPARVRLQRKSNSSKLARRKWRCQYGVMAVRVNDTALRARLQGWIDSMKRQWLDSLSIGA